MPYRPPTVGGGHRSKFCRGLAEWGLPLWITEEIAAETGEVMVVRAGIFTYYAEIELYTSTVQYVTNELKRSNEIVHNSV